MPSPKRRIIFSEELARHIITLRPNTHSTSRLDVNTALSWTTKIADHAKVAQS